MKLRIFSSITGRPNQSGIATVETAIVMLILIVLLLISVEFGRLFYHANEFNKSVRNSARYVSNNALDVALLLGVTDEDRAKAKNLLIYGDITGDVSDAGNRYTLFSGLTADDITITETDPHYITVEAEWTYLTLFGSTLPSFGISSEDSFTLKAASTMRVLE